MGEILGFRLTRLFKKGMKGMKEKLGCVII